LLDNGARDCAIFHTTKSDRLFVEADDLDLADLVRLLQRFVNLWRVVAIESNHAIDVGTAGQRLLDVAPGARRIEAVGEHFDELDLRALDCRPHTLDALAGIVRGWQTNVAH